MAEGATGTRHSPRPPWGRKINAQLARIAPRGREVASGFVVIASAAKQSILSLRGEMDCFAEPVIGAHSRDPVARNDGSTPNFPGYLKVESALCTRNATNNVVPANAGDPRPALAIKS